MKKRSIPAIALKASNNAGGFYFMSLYSGKWIHGYIWEEFPIDESVIDRVEKLAIIEKQPFLVDNHPIFEWSPSWLVDDFTDNENENILEQNKEREREIQQQNEELHEQQKFEDKIENNYF